MLKLWKIAVLWKHTVQSVTAPGFSLTVQQAKVHTCNYGDFIIQHVMSIWCLSWLSAKWHRISCNARVHASIHIFHTSYILPSNKVKCGSDSTGSYLCRNNVSVIQDHLQTSMSTLIRTISSPHNISSDNSSEGGLWQPKLSKRDLSKPNQILHQDKQRILFFLTHNLTCLWNLLIFTLMFQATWGAG